jgi:uncharacterized protein YbjT (DUF2867 family)
MISVMGATGHVGGEIARRLLAAGQKVRVLGRSREKLAEVTGGESLVGDAADAAYLASAFRGADAVFTLLPPDLHSADYRGLQDRQGEAIAKALRDAGVRNVVFLSSVGADQPSGTGPIAGLHAQEERLRALTDTNVLALRPGFFFENFYGSLPVIKHQGVLADAVAPDVTLPMVATRDIAAAATEALLSRDLRGFAVRELLGPRDLTHAEVTRIIGERIGRPDLPYVQVPYADMVRALVGAGLSENVSSLYVEMSRAFNEGRVHSVEGRKPSSTTPTRFEDFAAELARAYQAM